MLSRNSTIEPARRRPRPAELRTPCWPRRLCGGAASSLRPAGAGEGLSNAQIAARLYLSEATIKGYVSRMLDKLGCANRTQAGLLAHDAGIVKR
jgi:hypothetical protein